MAKLNPAPDVDELQDIIDDAIADAEGRLSSSYLNEHLAKHGWEIRAKPPEVLVALKQLYEDTADYIRINKLGDVHQNKSMRDARDAIAKATS
jgi:hypothetical protein